MNPPLTQEDAAKRCRMAIRAFRWDEPLPIGFLERMRAFDNGTDRSEEMWYGDYKLTPIEEDETPPSTLGTWKKDSRRRTGT